MEVGGTETNPKDPCDTWEVSTLPSRPTCNNPLLSVHRTNLITVLILLLGSRDEGSEDGVEVFNRRRKYKFHVKLTIRIYEPKISSKVSCTSSLFLCSLGKNNLIKLKTENARVDSFDSLFGQN